MIVIFVVTFALPQSVWEHAKLRAIGVMRASVVCVPTCQTRANFSFWPANKSAKVGQIFNLGRQRANGVSTFQFGMPNGMPIFHFGVPACQKACKIFKHSSYEMISEIPYFMIVSETRRRRDIKIPLPLGPDKKKFNIVRNNHGCTQKCNFCIICQFSLYSFVSPLL